MRKVSRSRAVPLLMFLSSSCWLVLLAAAAAAGDVRGRVTRRAPVSAGLGSMSGPQLLEQAIDRGPAAGHLGPVLVYVGEAQGQLPRQGDRVTLRVEEAGLAPAVSAAAVGTAVRLANATGRDQRFAARGARRSVDLGWVPAGRTVEVTFEQVGRVALWGEQGGELGEVVVLPHAAFVVVDPGGRFAFEEVPAGPATIVAYSPDLGEVSRQVQVPADGKVSIDLVF